MKNTQRPPPVEVNGVSDHERSGPEAVFMARGLADEGGDQPTMPSSIQKMPT